MTKLVPNRFPVVTISPRIAIIGEAPGAEEEAAGIPFVGQSGRLLDGLLTQAKILRSGCFIGNVFQYRPPGNVIGSVMKSPQWVECANRLNDDLGKFQPNLVIALGETALHHLTGKTGISNWRGSIMASPFGMAPVIPSHHPAYVLRQWSWYPILKLDLTKARTEADNPKPLPKRELVICDDFTQAMSELYAIRAAPRVAFDIETVGSPPDPICIGFAASAERAIVIPFHGRHTELEEGHLLANIANLLEDPRVEKVAQNAQFDIGVMFYSRGIITQGLVMDTMLAHHACYPELPKSLAFQTSIYTREPYYKWEAHQTAGQGEAEWGQGVPRDQLWRYNAKDCCVTFEIAAALEKELIDLDAMPGFATDMRSLGLALEMTMRGLKVDPARCEARLKEIDEQIATASAELTETFGPINTKSPKQMKELLYAKLKLPEQRGASGSVTTDADSLIELARQYPGKNLHLLLKERQLRTKRSFFDLDISRAGRLHAAYNVSGTETGRWSSSSSFLGGRNVMNLPDDCRDIYVAG